MIYFALLGVLFSFLTTHAMLLLPPFFIISDAVKMYSVGYIPPVINFLFYEMFWGGVYIGNVLPLIIIFYSNIISLLFLYRIWAAIQDEHVKTTPAKAVGFLFVPLFSLYWLFTAYWGFARAFNSLIMRRNLDIKPLSEGLYLSYPVLLLLWPFVPPGLDYIVFIAVSIVHLIIITDASAKVNALDQERV